MISIKNKEKLLYIIVGIINTVSYYISIYFLYFIFDFNEYIAIFISYLIALFIAILLNLFLHLKIIINQLL